LGGEVGCVVMVRETFLLYVVCARDALRVGMHTRGR
jgi:hypothetical protein